eukprot:16008559-Heterocapsa_arctica.AAC.1
MKPTAAGIALATEIIDVERGTGYGGYLSLSPLDASRNADQFAQKGVNGKPNGVNGSLNGVNG